MFGHRLSLQFFWRSINQILRGLFLIWLSCCPPQYGPRLMVLKSLIIWKWTKLIVRPLSTSNSRGKYPSITTSYLSLSWRRSINLVSRVKFPGDKTSHRLHPILQNMLPAILWCFQHCEELFLEIWRYTSSTLSRRQWSGVQITNVRVHCQEIKLSERWMQVSSDDELSSKTIVLLWVVRMLRAAPANVWDKSVNAGTKWLWIVFKVLMSQISIS